MLASICEPRRNDGTPEKLGTRSERAGRVVDSFTINLQGPEETVFFDV
jgi:hypothetical protein